MSNKIGRFEILSEISHSEMASVYKVSDPESGQTIALKTLRLEMLGEQAGPQVQEVLEEVGRAKALSSHNIAQVYGAEEMDGRFCAAMEYVQGNSIATMLARKEGFSIWDLRDIARQTCQGLDHAHVHNVVHYSLEPAKLMVTWDGTVKLLGFGISTMGAYAAQAAGQAPEVLHYMSPEQLRGAPLDARSNLFSLGAILYEMVTERKAFEGEDADWIRQQILEQMPVAPDRINPKLHPVLSEVIMRALSKAPEERYQSGPDLVNDLERCKESSTKSEARKTQATPVPKEQLSAPAAGGDAPAPSRQAAAAAAGQGMSAAAAAASEVVAPHLPVDPLMDEGNKAATPRGPSFSEIDELPPLKEVRIAPPTLAEPEAFDQSPVIAANKTPKEKSKVQPREVAKKAVREIRTTPPKLFMYAIAAAVSIILLVVVGIAFHIHSENAEEAGSPAQSSSASSAHADAGEPSTSAVAQGHATEQAPSAVRAVAPERVAAAPGAISVRPRYNDKRKPKMQPTVIIPGQLTINSTPEGAQVQVDGRKDTTWITPYNMTGLVPGQHTVSISKVGYAPENRTIDVASGSKSFLVVQLAQLVATVAVASQPAGAAVFVDGKDTGRVTPAQILVDKPGSHTFLVRKQGYLEETTAVNLQAGQSFHFAPILRALGTTDDIKMGGRFKKIFGGRDTAGMGTVSIKTQPKGAQVTVNNRMLDKGSPVEFHLNPGTYLIDITLSGFKPIHRVINVEKGNKVAMDETMERE
jgi:serine/threonine protein kinase